MLSNNKSIQVSNNCKIYIMSPANTATGGPEALHQLAYVLQNSLKLNTFIYYIPVSEENPVHKNYEMYSIEFVKEIQDSSENILIIPELANLGESGSKSNIVISIPAPSNI